MEDQDMLNMLRQTPELGMQALIEQYAGLVHAVAKSRLRTGVFCAADVENCAADTFSEFYLDLDKYSPEKGSIRAWLCVIAKHNALDLVRQRYRESNALPLEEDLSAVSEDALPEWNLEERELRRVLLEEVKLLGEPDREILLRKFYFGESSREIAGRLDMTVTNVDTKTHRAIEKLRKKLKEWR